MGNYHSNDNIEEYARKIGFSLPSKMETLERLTSDLSRTPNNENFFPRMKEVNILSPEEVFDCAVADGYWYVSEGFCSFPVQQWR